jgi:hypothetical protein
MLYDIYSSYFTKISQVLNNNLDSSSNVTDSDKSLFTEHIKAINESAGTINDWVKSNLGANNNDTRLLELSRFVEAMYNSAKILSTSEDSWSKDNTLNKTITTVEQKLQPIVQNYNAIRPNYIDEDWIQRYSSTDEAKAVEQIKNSIEFAKKFIEKQKRVETSGDLGTPLPEL